MSRSGPGSTLAYCVAGIGGGTTVAGLLYLLYGFVWFGLAVTVVGVVVLVAGWRSLKV